MSKNWIAVASAEHVRLGRSNGFMQVSHGKSASLRRIEPGDRVVFYSPTDAFRGKDKLQSFTAIFFRDGFSRRLFYATRGDFLFLTGKPPIQKRNLLSKARIGGSIKLAIKALAARHRMIADPSAAYPEPPCVSTAFMMAAPTI
jgi:hypothetical protein